jgi:hypothetical protein
MTRHDDFTAQLEGYLDEYEGLTPLPAAVRNAVRGALPTTKQSGQLRGPLRYLNMTMSLPGPARFAAMAAVVAALAVAGYALAPRSNVGSGETPQPTSSVSTRADVLRDGPLPAGTYITNPFATENATMSFTFTVPGGWQGRSPWGLERTEGSGQSQLLGIGFVRAGALFADPCHWRTSGKEVVAVGPHIDDLVEALQAQPMYETSSAANASIGGYTGKKVDIQLPANVDLSTCDDGAYYLWESPTKSVGYNISAQSAGARFHVWILDVQGARVLVVTRDFASTFAVERAELQQIVDSIRIEWND